MTPKEGWVGVEEVAAHLQVAEASIYRWVESKDFPAHRVGRLLRFNLSEVDEWVRRHRTFAAHPGSKKSRNTRR